MTNRHAVGSGAVNRSAALARLALPVAICLGAGLVQAHAAPVVPPGELLGVALGTPLHQGWYVLDTTSYGQVPGPDGKAGAQVGFNIPILIWSSPLTILGGRVEPFVSQPVLFGDRAGNGAEGAGFYNTLAGAGITWQLTPHLGASYLLGIYFPTSDKYAFASASSRQDFSLSYGDDDYSVTGHITYGNIFDHVARFGNGLVQRNSDYVNFEGTALRKIGKFELGPVMIGSTDVPLSSKFIDAGYVPSGELGFGGLAGYQLGPVSLQAYVTRDVIERGPNGPDTRGWLRLVIPFGGSSRSVTSSHAGSQ